MVELGALSIPAVVLQGRGGYGTSERISAEGFADLLNLQSNVTQGLGSQQATFSIVSRPGTIPKALFTIQSDTAYPEATVESTYTDTEVVVVIPAGETGRDDLVSLIAQLLGLEENDDFLCELNGLIEKIMPDAELAEPITFEGLDEILEKLRDLIAEEENPKRILLPLFTLFIFPVITVTPEMPEPETDGALSEIEAAAPETPVSSDGQATEAPEAMPTETQAVQTEEAPATQAQTTEAQPLQTESPKAEESVQTTETQAVSQKSENEPIAQTPMKTDAEPTEVSSEPTKAQTPQASQTPQTPQAQPAEANAEQAPPEWANDIQSVSVTQSTDTPEPVVQIAAESQTEKNAEATPEETAAPPPDEGKPIDKPRRYADFARHKLRMIQAAQNPKPETEAPVNPETAVTETDTPDPIQRITHTDSGQSEQAEEQPATKQNTLSDDTLITPQTSQNAPVAETAEQPQQSPIRQALAQNVIDQIVQTAALRQSTEGTTLTMELAPKFLGKLSLILTATADGVTAKIRTENDAVRSLLSGNLEALKLTLKDAGINMKNIEITDSNVGWDIARNGQSGMQFHSGARQRNGYEESGNSPPAIGIEGFGSFADDTTLAATGTLYRTGRVAAGPDDTAFDYRA